MRILIFIAVLFSIKGFGQNPGSNHGNRFEQLGNLLPTPNEYRTASGAPGPKYWQQQADYVINCSLDETQRKITGTETVTYHNYSPDKLTYLWLQLDENEHSKKMNANYQDWSNNSKNQTATSITRNIEAKNDEDKLGCKIEKVTDALGKPISYVINKTMIRIDLPKTLLPGEKFVFKINWHYFMSNRMTEGGRGGYENFPEDGNDVNTITQWFPRMCVYSDNQGWQNHQFTGRGEFTLTFGNYNVNITVPADHVVMGTGECQNYVEVLGVTEQKRWASAQTAKEPVEIVTLDEAKAKEKGKSAKTKTWRFKATNVRDFAWTSSRKFIWDAMPAYVEGKKVMCMSGYPKEAYALYRKYSTKVVAHTIKSYSQFTIPYPYPVAQSIEGNSGMEYPMICFNFGRTEKDGTYSMGTKYGMIGVIVHEVGHNFFPMIVNSDERQWSWMDEGLNTYVEYLAEELFENNFPSRRGPAYTIAGYMGGTKDNLEPIMSNSENIVNFGANAYSKPATGLNILRESIVGRELFDFAFKTYSKRWAFKHPTPADFFRTIEDATAEDLDWYWRGWFFGIEPVDISLDSVKSLVFDGNTIQKRSGLGGGGNFQMPPMQKPYDDISKIRNRQDPKIKFAVDVDPSLKDFYSDYKPWEDTVRTPNAGGPKPENVEIYDTLSPKEIELAKNAFFYEVHLTNKGGMVMPVIIEWRFADGTTEVDRIPAQIWRKNENRVVKSFMKTKQVVSIKLDPFRETADINEKNNVLATMPEPSAFKMFKDQGGARGRRDTRGGENPMQRDNKKNNVTPVIIY
jgi:hypothetical protein